MLRDRSERPLLTRPRNWIAERLWKLAHALYVDEDAFLPKCPDCGIAPDYGPDSECDVCVARQDDQHRENDIYEAGWRAADEEAARWEAL